MAFNSLHFLLFFPVVLGLYFLVNPDRRWLLLFVASCYFYMAWRPEYIVLILGESVLAYMAGLALVRSETAGRRTSILAGSIGALLAVLFVFKYYNFFNDSMRAVVESVGWSWPLPAADLILPLGISFHTFILIGYIIDVHRRKIPPETNPGLFGVFSIYFPLLVAGPIERAESLLPQFRREQTFDADRVQSGFRLMAWGFFKKVAVADRLAPFVDTVYSAPRQHDGLTLMVGTVFFAVQIYCDFSGYTDIARGAARTMGIDLTVNFRQPYFATSIGDFWKRWHISLSTWLTDYVYSAFTRAKWLKLKWYPKFLASLMLTFLVSGIWHGAAWTYVVWGALHGSYLVGSMLTQRARARLVSAVGLNRVPALHTAVQVAITFGLVCLTYVFFRAESVADAVYIVTHVLAGATEAGGSTPTPDYILLAGALTGFVLAVDAWSLVRNVGHWLANLPGWMRWTVDYAIVTGALLLGVSGSSASFIYFQF